jgi:hypothetical protein
MEKKKIITLIIVSTVGIVAVGIIGWAPWITEVQAYNLVMEKLGGPDELYYYLGEMTPLKDIPKTFVKLPFISSVYFPGEAVYIVTFFNLVI